MIINGLFSALRTLTIIPVLGPEPLRRVYALPWFILAGALLGGLQGGLLFGMQYLPSSVGVLSGFFCTIFNYVITGGLHIDGAGDTADALGTWHSREKTLEILKDPHMGSFGTLAICGIFIWRVLIYQQMYQLHLYFWIIPALIFSRNIQGILLGTIPYARPAGGKAAGFSCSRVMIVILFIEFLCVLAALCYFAGPVRTGLPLGIAILMVALLTMYAVKKLGGITGDIVGAATELFECTFLSLVLCPN